MKKKLLFVCMLLALIAISSCSDENPPRMIWKFMDYDDGNVSATFSGNLIYQVDIIAMPDYEGTMTLKCTNYSQLDIIPNSFTGSPANPELGYSVSKIGDNTLKISFQPVESSDEYNAGIVQIEGKNGKDTNWSSISIRRMAW